MILGWIILTIMVAMYGSKKNIGLSAFFISLLLSPLIGFIYVFVSKDPDFNKPYKQFLDKAKREVYKENYAQAIDDYKNALYHLENDYEDVLGKSAIDRDNLILKLKSKVNDLESKVNLHPESNPPHKELY